MTAFHDAVANSCLTATGPLLAVARVPAEGPNWSRRRPVKRLSTAVTRFLGARRLSQSELPSLNSVNTRLPGLKESLKWLSFHHVICNRSLRLKKYPCVAILS